MLRLLAIAMVFLCWSSVLAFAQDAVTPQLAEDDPAPGISDSLAMRMLLSTILYSPEGEDDPGRFPKYEPYDPIAALDTATGWHVDEGVIRVPHGKLEITNGWILRPAGCDFDQYLIAGDLWLVLNSLPPNSDEYLNIFDYRKPGYPVKMFFKAAFLCAGEDYHPDLGKIGTGQARQVFNEIPGTDQERLRAVYLANYHRSGWLEDYDFELPPEIEELPNVLRPSCGFPVAPEADEFLMCMQGYSMNALEYSIDHDGPCLLDTGTARQYLAKPRRQPLLACQPVESKRNFTVTGHDYWVDYHRGNPDDWNNDPTTCSTKTVYDLTLPSLTGHLFFSRHHSRTTLSVTDGEGNELEWEDEFVKLGQPRDLVVVGKFEPGREYRVVINDVVDSRQAHKDMGPNLYKFELGFLPGAPGARPRGRIALKLDCGPLNYIAGPGAVISEKDGWTIADWPAGCNRRYLAGYKYTLSEFDGHGVKLHCLSTPELAGSDLLQSNLDFIAQWLALRREVIGPWTYDDASDFLIMVEEGQGNSAHDPSMIKLKLSDPPINKGQIWQLSNTSLERGFSERHVEEPQYWRDALLDLLMFRASELFSEHLVPGRAEFLRQNHYRAHVTRYLGGPAEDLLAMELEQELGFRITAVLQAVNHVAPHELYDGILLPLRRKGLAQGTLSFDEISAAFLEQRGSVAADQWQRYVLDGEFPRGGPDHDPAMPGVTDEMGREIHLNVIYRVLLGKLYSDPAGILLVADKCQLGPEDSKRYWTVVWALYYIGRYQDALDALDAYIAATPPTAHELEVNRLKGMDMDLRPACLAHLERYDEARSDILDSLAGLDPEEDKYQIRDLEKLLAFIEKAEPEVE